MVESVVVVHGVDIEVNVTTVETPALIINKKTAIVGLFGAGKLPANKGGDKDLAMLGKIVGSDGNVRSQSSVVSSQAIWVAALVEDFKALVTVAGAATEVNNLVANLTRSFHDESISVGLLNLGDGLSSTSLDFNHLAAAVVFGMGDPVVGKCTGLLEQLALFLGGLDGLLRTEETGIIMASNSRLSLFRSGGGSHLGNFLSPGMVFLGRLLGSCSLANTAICLDNLRRTADSDTAVRRVRC
jgi:hypothetical protein